MSMQGLSFAIPTWPTLAPLLNHLWQSTVFAGAAGLLTLVLRSNQAKARYWIWLIASLKFLLPFSPLVALGSRLATPARSVPEYLLFMQEISQIFDPLPSAQQAAPGILQTLLRVLPALLLIGWLCGFVAVLLFWIRRWQRISSVLRNAVPLNSGREAEMLRRIEQSEGMMEKTTLMVAATALEPGVVGIFRPIMLLPQGISERLSDAQLEAVLTHELCHVRRRDNLAAALHMLVEAFFWFHPLVWWIGARLVVERERACDEEVLRRGSEPQEYAEGILKVCEFYLESPLSCIAGVTGSNLKQRIEEIMVRRIAQKLNLAKKLLLATAATAALLLPVVFGLLHPARSQAQSTPSVFQEVSLRPAGAIAHGDVVHMRFYQENGTMHVRNVTLQHLLNYAYGLPPSQMAGAPDWLNSELYDLDIKTSEDLQSEKFRRAAQELFAHHFKLAVHRELRSASIYELRVGANGPKLAQANPKVVDQMKVRPVGRLEATNAHIDELVKFLRNFTGREVVDKTGLNGSYDFTLDAEGLSMNGARNSEDISSLQKAVAEQLGLELSPQTGMVNMLVIDHVERIAGNSAH